MQPRIYTYKITFEEVPYYYYGSKKEKYFNQTYWGSPVTNKWCWELYTPKKQILEIFDYSDEGYSKCISVENRLIKPVLNDPWCLNESCSNFYSLKTLSNAGKKGGKITGTKNKKESRGIFNLTDDERKKNSGRGGLKTVKLKVGLFGMTKQQLLKNSKKTNSQRWECCETGYISTAAGVVSYQKGKGIDTSKKNRKQIS